MRWYTAIGIKKDDADGRFCVWVDGEEKVLTEMETILWAALTWSFCEEDKVHSQMHRLLVFSLGEKQAQEWADKEDFQFCLNRLVKRGLVVLTEGCTREEAVYSIISRSVMSPMAFSRTERMKHFMEALSMGKGLKFSLRAFKKPLLTEEEYQLLSYLQREGDVSCHLKCLKEEAKSSNSVFASNQLSTAGATRRIFAQVSRILLRIEAKMPILSCTSITGARASKMAMIIPGTTTSMMPICTKRVVRKIRINNLGNIGALAPIARSALTL